MTDFYKAEKQDDNSILYESFSGTRVIKRGGSVAWRNNNPGNLERGNFSSGSGSIGDDGRFAIFPDYRAGRKALKKLLTTKTYKDLTLEQALNRYAPSDENDTEAYLNFIENKSSADRRKKITDLDEKEFGALLDAIERYEGYIAGEQIPLPKPKPLYDATGRLIRE